MNVLGVDMQGYMLHEKLYRLLLPTKGIVLMTGPNGAGKSSVMEGVATAAWGETLRGTPGWRQEESGEVGLFTDMVEVQRTRKASGTGKLKWNELGKPATEWENNPKAQAGLDAIIGSFNVWRRTHVFSSHDAEHFTMATDSERKRLLEEILNLSRFDDALDKCRADLKSAKALLLGGESQLAVLTGQLEESERRLADAKRAIATLPPEQDLTLLKAERVRLQEMVRGVSGDRERVMSRMRKMDLIGATQLAEAREMERRATSLSGGDCDRCGQGIPAELIAGLRADVASLRALAEAAKGAAAEEAASLAVELSELNDEADALQRKLTGVEGQVTLQAGVAKQWATAKATLEGATSAVASLLTRIETGTGIVATHRDTVAVLNVVDDVLGMKGARAHVLGTALRGVEQVANSWLTRIAGPGLQLLLKSYTEKKTGGVSDSINLEVKGAGGGYGYRASSGGERRRVDVALLLALAEVASAAHGTTPGTMWFDEVFDALDEQGVDAVRDALLELSADRAVVVVTHNQMLVDRLPATQRVRFDTGVVARSK